MIKYIARRLLLVIPVVIGVTIVVFSIMYLVPGDPAVAILGADSDPQQLAAIREKLHLNDPYLVRLGRYMKQIFLQGDFGDSYISGVPILSELAQRAPRTLIIDIFAILTSLVFGVPLGVFAATHQNKRGDYLTMGFTLFAISIPNFWLALMLVLLFSNTLGWLPPYGLGGIEYWILPIVSSSVFGIGLQARQTRSSMLEVLNSDYIVMARSKGLPERKVIYNHALPNALIPVITIAGTTFGVLLGGGLLVETIFSIPGVGYFMVKAVNSRDYPAIQGSILLLAVAFSIVILLTDLAYAAIDPRIKSHFATNKNKKKKEVKANA